MYRGPARVFFVNPAITPLAIANWYPLTIHSCEGGFIELSWAVESWPRNPPLECFNEIGSLSVFVNADLIEAFQPATPDFLQRIAKEEMQDLELR